MLDDYSGAAAMYGLALLNSDYSGNAITVRRASDNATQNIGFDGQDLDIAALESFCSGTDGFVTTWYDQSGNANNVTQTTAADQPQIVSSGSVILENGKAALQFDGVDDYLKNSTANVLISDDSLIGVLFNNTRALNTNVIDSNETTKFFLQYEILGSTYKFDNSLNNVDLNFNTVSTQLLIILQFDGTTLDSYLNGSNTSTYSVGSNSVTGLTIGRHRQTSANHLQGTMQSLLIWNTNQSANRTGIETALNDYYSIY